MLEPRGVKSNYLSEGLNFLIHIDKVELITYIDFEFIQFNFSN